MFYESLTSNLVIVFQNILCICLAHIIFFDMSLIWARVSLFIMEFLIFGKPYSDNTTDIDKTNKQNTNAYFQNLLSTNS